MTEASVRQVTIQQYRERIDVALGRMLDELLEGAPAGVADAVRYAVMGPGKRIRPLLLMAACRATGGNPEAAAPLACSVEFVHAYSLVHDDLPCMDDDVLRRGRPTVHVRYGTRAAVLAGAALMPLAVQAIWSGSGRLALDEALTHALVARLTVAAGARGMVGGQLLDLRAEGRDVSPAELETIHLGKTARLIAASVAMGGMAAGAAGEDVDRLERFGTRLGLAFQATDDILDLRGTTDELGKESGRDAVLRKATFPAVYGLDQAERLSRDLVVSAERELEGLPKADDLRTIADWILARRY